MSIHRFSHLWVAIFIAVAAHAQPYWQKGSRLASVGGSAFITGTSSDITNARLALLGGSCAFLTPTTAVGLEGSIDLASMTQAYATTGRVHFLASGASDQDFSLLLDAHVGMAYRENQTVIGESFNSSDVKVGMGAQCTWWVSQSAGIYLWPQLSKTNGGPSGLWEWQLTLPIGVQWNWYQKP